VQTLPVQKVAVNYHIEKILNFRNFPVPLVSPGE
jgi:hypothetical protein